MYGNKSCCYRIANASYGPKLIFLSFDLLVTKDSLHILNDKFVFCCLSFLFTENDKPLNRNLSFNSVCTSNNT